MAQYCVTCLEIVKSYQRKYHHSQIQLIFITYKLTALPRMLLHPLLSYPQVEFTMRLKGMYKTKVLYGRVQYRSVYRKHTNNSLSSMVTWVSERIHFVSQAASI